MTGSKLTRPGEDAAIEAVKTAMAAASWAPYDDDPDTTEAAAVVAAAYPLIAAAVLDDARQQIVAHADGVLKAAEETRGTHEYALFASADLMARIALDAVSGSERSA